MTGANEGCSTTSRDDHALVSEAKQSTLTDEQWIEIVRHSNLPNAARQSVESAIVYYREMQMRIEGRKTPAELRDELEVLREDTEALLQRLAKLLADPDAFFSLSFRQASPRAQPQGAGPVSREVAVDRLSSAGHQLRRLADWLAAARDQVRPGKPGTNARQSEPAYVLAEGLNDILEHWIGKTLTRSSKRQCTTRFVEAVCKVADPEIGSGTIAEAIKRQIKYRLERGKLERGLPEVTSPRKPRDKRSNARKTSKRDFRTK